MPSVRNLPGSVSSVRTSPPRLLWIDFLRGLAVLGMVEAHSVNSFLAPVYRSGGAFAFLSYVNGAVAPVFLFISGFLQGASLRKNWENPKPAAPKWWHLAVILLLGYALQFPWDALVHWQHSSTSQILSAVGKIDILHCIAVSLAVTLLLRKMCRRVVTFDALLALLIGAVIIAAPWIWNSVENSTNTNPFLGYVSPLHGSLFPLLPWSGYLLAGTLASRWQGRPRTFALLFAITCALGWCVRFLFGNWLELQSYAARYDTVLFRLSVVLLSCAICSLLLTNDRPQRFTRAINWCGACSLSLYVWHLVLLHSGLGIVPPLRDLFSRTQTPSTVLPLFLLTLAGSIILTVLWRKVKQWLASIFSRVP